MHIIKFVGTKQPTVSQSAFDDAVTTICIDKLGRYVCDQVGRVNLGLSLICYDIVG
jgi:hypothetical protein